MPTFKLDGKEIPFEPGDTIIRAAWKVGIEIPHYCWHPGLSSPANCRMCLVETKPAEGQRALMLDVVELDSATGQYKSIKKPKLLPACQQPAVEGADILSDSSGHVTEARKYVQEALLLNHPVDCPICDQAGECKLQDYWLTQSGEKKRMRDEPIHKPKAVSFGDTIVYDGERCVMCTRCVRFMDEVAKDPVLDMRERGNFNEIFVAPGRKLEGNYTMMTDHVCPVGALTTKDFRFKARVWFLKSSDSICQGCATGCNAHLDVDPRKNTAHRYRPRDNESVNKFWMCDTGMISYTRAHDGRIVQGRITGRETIVSDALGEAAKELHAVPGSSIAVLLSAQHSVEDNWALLAFAKALGTSNVFWAGNVDGKADDILISSDKNPNTTGVRQLAPKAANFHELVAAVRARSFTHVISLGSEVQSPDLASELGHATLIAISAHEGPLSRAARVVLPATSWAEAQGTFVNGKGMAQVSMRALNAQGASRPAWKLVGMLMNACGHKPSWDKLQDIHTTLWPSDARPAEQLSV